MESPLEQYRIPNIPTAMYYIPNFIQGAQQDALLSSLPSHRWVHLSHRRLQAHPSTLTKNNTLLAATLPCFLQQPIIPMFKDLGVFHGSPHRSPNHVLINEYRPGEGIMPHEDGDAYWPCVATVSLGGSIVLDVHCKPDNTASQSSSPGSDEVTTNDMITDTFLESEKEGEQRKHYRILQEPGSLLVTTGDAYRSTLHGIREILVDEDLNAETVANWTLLGEDERQRVMKDGGRNIRVTRTSLTYRDVLKVSGLGAKILGSRRT